MKNILVEIKCNRCFYHTHIKSHTLVLPDLEPNLRKRILSNDMFDYTCPRCGQEISFSHPFLYHDKVHQFLILVSQENKDVQELQTQFPSSEICLVTSTADVKEKIAIHEDHLQDERIEVIKKKLKNKYPSAKHISYKDYDKDSDSLWFTFSYSDQKEEIKGVEMSVYIACKI